MLPFLYISVTNSCSWLVFVFEFFDCCPAVPLSRPYKTWDSGTPRDTLGHQASACIIPCTVNEAVILYTAMCRLLFHALFSSFPYPVNNSACFVSLTVPLVPCCPTCPIVPLPVCWDSGTLGTAAFLSSLLRWIIRLTVDLPQFTCEAISLTDLPDWDNCRIWQSLWLDSLSPSFFRCSFSVE